MNFAVGDTLRVRCEQLAEEKERTVRVSLVSENQKSMVFHLDELSGLRIGDGLVMLQAVPIFHDPEAGLLSDLWGNWWNVVEAAK